MNVPKQEYLVYADQVEESKQRVRNAVLSAIDALDCVPNPTDADLPGLFAGLDSWVEGLDPDTLGHTRLEDAQHVTNPTIVNY